jgi:hypothetical protein
VQVRTRLRLVALSAVLALSLIAAATSSGATATTGYDISYPQCNGSFPSPGAFAIVGVNGGKPYSPNPCLGTGDGPSELQWAGMNAGFYANTADPGPALSTHWPSGQTSPKECNTSSNPGTSTVECAYDYGWNAAADSYQDAVAAYVSLGWASAGSTRTPVANEWWLDVESANSWLTDTAMNVAELQGEADYLASVGAASVGFYANGSDWQAITGGTTAFASYPSWVPGAGSLSQAQANCGGSGVTGGGVALAQYLSGGFDGDVRCGAPAPALSFASPPQTLTAGASSGAMTVALPQAAGAAVTVSLSSSAATGRFATSVSGPWSSTLQVTVPAGSTTSSSFYYEDTKAGSPVLTASATGYSDATQTESVVSGPLASITVSPATAKVRVGSKQTFSASGADQYGNAVSVAPSWSVSPSSLGTFSPTQGASVTFTAASAGSGRVTASSGSVQGTASITVVQKGHR